LLDTTVVLCVAAISLPDLLSGGSHAAFGEPDSREQLPAAVAYVLFAAFLVPLWWRRRAPATAFFATASAAFASAGLGIELTVGFCALLIALYSVARYGSLRLLGWATALAAGANAATALTLARSSDRLSSLLFLLGMVTTAAATGLTLRVRRMYMTALEDRAARLEVERDQRAQLTAAAERARIAHEMHDIVGHSLSVMITLADGAAALATRNQEQSAHSLRMLGDTGRNALDELRRVLGVLRADRESAGEPLRPQPGIADLDALLAQVRAAGLAVTYRTAGHLATLSGGLQLTVYRIVQEALTNTLKHAGTAATAEVTLTADADTLRVRVTDTGTPPNAPAPAIQPRTETEEPGHGLVGIRQRAALYGGAVTIGPRDGRPGWIVDVQLDATIEPPAG